MNGQFLGRFEKLGLGFVRRAAGEERGRRREMKGSRILYLLYKRVDRVGSDPVHFPCIVGCQILALGYPDQSNVPGGVKTDPDPLVARVWAPGPWALGFPLFFLD